MVIISASKRKTDSGAQTSVVVCDGGCLVLNQTVAGAAKNERDRNRRSSSAAGRVRDAGSRDTDAGPAARSDLERRRDRSGAAWESRFAGSLPASRPQSYGRWRTLAKTTPSSTFRPGVNDPKSMLKPGRPPCALKGCQFNLL